MRSLSKIIGCGLVLAGWSAANAAETVGAVTLSVTGFNSDQGQLICRLFKPGSGFPRGGPSQSVTAVITARASTCIFRDIAPGTYAIAIAHDKNRNNKLDTNLLGIPTEGYGFSKNLKPVFSAPKFKAAAFEVGSGPTRLAIKMRY